MTFQETKLNGAYVVELDRLVDDRGFFGRFFCRREFKLAGISHDIKQINLSYSHLAGTVRGLHYQAEPNQESKFIYCSKGAIFDIMVDMRKGSVTYLQWVGTELRAEDSRMVYVPEGFAHGYATLADKCEVIYSVSGFYAPESERGIRWDDPAIGIQWPVSILHVSDKDLRHQYIDPII